ncbi:MAG: hypothetical protein HY017_32570 [Betaproteobacteria bacterium]|nr:hypothetical protein [Betaproteobacteria bacterium]
MTARRIPDPTDARRSVSVRDDRIEMTAPVRLQRHGRLLVAVPQRKLPKLPPETVEQTSAKLLDDRARGV